MNFTQVCIADDYDVDDGDVAADADAGGKSKKSNPSKGKDDGRGYIHACLELSSFYEDDGIVDTTLLSASYALYSRVWLDAIAAVVAGEIGCK
jgi:hypothetical protein